MMIFDLRCAVEGHVFEAWFASSAAYDEQRARGLVSCPLCGSVDVAKAPMAPAVGTGGSPGPLSGAPGEVKALLAEAAAVQRRLLDGSEAVGRRFAEEARAIHLGDAPARPIHGEASTGLELRVDEAVHASPARARIGGGRGPGSEEPEIEVGVGRKVGKDSGNAHGARTGGIRFACRSWTHPGNVGAINRRRSVDCPGHCGCLFYSLRAE